MLDLGGLIGLLNLRRDDKLHLSDGPGIWTWTFSIGLATFGLMIAILATESVVEQCFWIVGTLVLALMCTGQWKDCVMDRSKNLVTLTRRNWYGRLCSEVSMPDTAVFPLRSVSGVEVRGNALHLVLFSNETVVVGTHSNSRHLRHIRDEVASFLRVGRVEPVQWGDLGAEWYLEYRDAMNTQLDQDQPTPATQHSGVKVLVQPDPNEAVA